MLFRGLRRSGSMCVGVTLWYGCGGEVSVCRLSLYSSLVGGVREREFR